ncbi:hypothetical protein LSUE1_G000421 [Lachnellula suecica]|uniref:ADP-ribosylation factor n=1 Tax=Lachnellula suecica TaxID=602035 RepID=A0A8T9CIZ2_9HELO|nr:hypothetical protein LSUE1_G000421 [Lachnellula suecica]
MAESATGPFQNYDNPDVFKESEQFALDPATKNFVVDFGLDEAQIAFDLGEAEFNSILQTPHPAERPIRWINIWGPSRQQEQVIALGEEYGFSRRLKAIILTDPIPPEEDKPLQAKHLWSKHSKDDVELAAKSMDLPGASPHGNPNDFGHYTIAAKMMNYHAIDYGSRFICIGANWMHQETHDSPEVATDKSIIQEGKQRRLYSWLILCNDNTVISLQEYPFDFKNGQDLKATRSNLLSVLSQLSKVKYDATSPLSLQSVRQALADFNHENPGQEGASNLFYYLFDDWRAVYSTVDVFGKRLKKLQKEIFGSVTTKSYDMPDIEIIPRLHILGGQIRQMHHVYEGYKNLVERILEPPKPSATGTHGFATPRSMSMSMSVNATPNQLAAAKEPPVTISRSARARFERLGDRLQLLILSQTEEFQSEKDALMNTYFNINAQKDSKATARLSRAATLLAKLSVLFLPVGLMTSYFSVQIADLQDVYTSKDYWYSFAVIMSISVVALFFFSRLLMWATETLDALTKRCGIWLRHLMFRFRNWIRRMRGGGGG